jgi:hypothetical protein
MKKLLKFLLNLTMALIAVCLTLGILFLLKPSWQKSALDELLKKDDTRSWRVETVRIQPASIEVENIFILDGDVGAEIKFARVAGPIWKFPLTGHLDIRSGELTGLNLDLSKVRVGDPTSEDYQTLLRRVSLDPDFWEERVGLVLSKLSAMGIKVRIKDMQLGGMVLMPGDKVVPVRWMIAEADSDAPRLIRVEPYAPQRTTL